MSLSPTHAHDNSLSLATTIPSALLSLVCQHLDAPDVLRLLRCCSRLHRLSGHDSSFSSTAWRAAWLSIQADWSLEEWLLPYHKWLWDPYRERRVPLSMWQQAAPVLRYVTEYRSGAWTSQHQTSSNPAVLPPSPAKLRAALATEQATRWVKDECGKQQVVLSELSLLELRAMLPSARVPTICSHFVLSAVPHLQHLHVSAMVYSMSYWLGDTLSLVPRLRSLHLQGPESSGSSPQWARLYVHRASVTIDMDVALTALPSLTALTCTRLTLSVQDLIHIAAHATLECVQLFSLHCIDDGENLDFSTANTARRDNLENTQVMQDEKAAEHEKPDATQHVRDIQRLAKALARVIPSHRSISARLALANYISTRQPSRRRLWYDNDRHSKWSKEKDIEYCRDQHLLTVLQSTLQQQLNDLHQI